MRQAAPYHFFRSFWSLQIAGWLFLYLLLLAAAMPHLSEPGIFCYNTLGCVFLFAVTVALRPICRRAATRWKSGVVPQGAILFGACLLLGCAASIATALGTYGWARAKQSGLMLSWLQSAVALFLWCILYIGFKRQFWTMKGVSGEQDLPVPFDQQNTEETAGAAAQPQLAQEARRFVIRTGARIEVVYEENVLWISAAGDYVELHTGSGTYLLRETMSGLQKSLDPMRFVRIHRSRIVRWDQIAALTAGDNGEYRIRLHDGSEHRSSRTFAPILTQWLKT
jgi:hypothetical protein